jgi:DNA helicase-2/ATP-dependent DNA helicase PcrA
VRFPKLSELDRDQSAIYNGAPPEGTVLIAGPPGTGKSVIAFHRAHMLQQVRRNPRVLMFNKVLARYASTRGNVASAVPVSTLHSWVFSWWKRVTKHRHATPPTVDGEKFTHDWTAIQAETVVQATTKAGAQAVNWGHVVIDEGQDFPPAMYACLQLTMNVANAAGATPRMAVTVLADENQRLTPNKNSTIEEIRRTLGLNADDRNVFLLRKNYRNTRQVAQFAACFYVGLPTGQPDLPSRAGDLPLVSLVSRETHDKFLNACAEKIARYAKLKRTEEIGILVMRDSVRKSMFNRMKAKLQDERIEVQSYSSSDDALSAESLNFDKPGHVTVLNYASAKGLEFDAVFVVDPGVLMSNGSADLNVKMTLYVLCSRARSFLNVMLLDDDNAKRLLGWLPDVVYERETL